MSLDDVYKAASIAASAAVVIALIPALYQVRALTKTIRAQTCLKLIDDWKSAEIYNATSYLFGLLEQWKREGPLGKCKFRKLADKWVESRAVADRGSELGREWLQRRLVAQFLDKLGQMIDRGYIHADDVFRVVPEAPRLLLVLIPIEQAIQGHYMPSLRRCFEWDQPTTKRHLNTLQVHFNKWYAREENRQAILTAPEHDSELFRSP